ncbi:YaaC family protein [Deinococcus roseus]|nr:hypothetical protein [Deinococcus roseus]
MRQINIMSENPIEQVWLHLMKWESTTLAYKLIEERAQQSGLEHHSADSQQRLRNKARGVAYCLRNAREYLHEPGSSWSKRVLNGYYGLMALVGAVLIADPRSPYDLGKFEEATKMGHGLNNIDDPLLNFPEGQKIYITEDGLLVRYLSWLGLNPRKLAITGRVRELRSLTPEQCSQLISLDTLLASIVELGEFYQEVTGKTPLSTAARPSGVTPPLSAGWQGVQPDFKQDQPGQQGQVNLIRQQDGFLSTFQLLQPLSKNLSLTELVDAQGETLQGQNLYRSAMALPHYVQPLLESINDVLAMHYCLMYQLSILVRYRPSLWREISEGALDDYFALIKYYQGVFLRVVPQIALEKIGQVRLNIIAPGQSGN